MSNPISSLESTVINNAVSNMSDTELCNILKTIPIDVEIDTLIKCEQDNLDKIYRVKRENIENLSYEDTDSDEMKRVMECITQFSLNENPSIDDFMKISREMEWMISELKNDNERCKSDLSSLTLAYEKMRGNFFMYKDDLCDESLKVCKEKTEYTEGLIRLRYKTLETNIQTIKALEYIIQNISTQIT